MLNRIGLALCEDAAELDRYKRILGLVPNPSTRIDWLSRTLTDGIYYVEFNSHVPDSYKICESVDNINWHVVEPSFPATGAITTYTSPANPGDSPVKYFAVYLNGIRALPCVNETAPVIPGIL